ncbi:MAG: AzlC family ABC transporter permease [Firmicutes bacterium]|nr:AzlC family ABC transporter permease [Bacillota bacterium]
MEKSLKEIKEGMASGLPIVIGYFPIAMAFGILSKTVGLTLNESVLFSLLVFAGASQFMALNLISLGVGVGEIILTTLLVNFRHFLMSASISRKIKKEFKRWLSLIAFGITDEVFSVASFKKGTLNKNFMLSLQLVTYLSWVIGTGFGFLIGNILPTILKNSMGIALYAMFVAILVPEAKKSKEILILSLLSGLINLSLKFINILPKGWNIIISIILASSVGLLLFKKGEKNHE